MHPNLGNSNCLFCNEEYSNTLVSQNIHSDRKRVCIVCTTCKVTIYKDIFLDNSESYSHINFSFDEEFCTDYKSYIQYLYLTNEVYIMLPTQSPFKARTAVYKGKISLKKAKQIFLQHTLLK